MVDIPPVNFAIVDLKTGLLTPPWQQAFSKLVLAVNDLSGFFPSGVLPLDHGGTGIATPSGTTGSVSSKIVLSGTPTFDSTLGVGGATAAASGSGVTFPSTQSASTDVNTLDDYEEGDWTPSVGGNATYTSRSGNYTKIGDRVLFFGTLVINVLGTGSSSVISGLPFTAGVADSVYIGYFANLALSPYFITGFINGMNSFVLTGVTAAAASITSPLAALGNGAEIRFGGHYKAF